MLAKGSSAWNIFIELDALEAAGYVVEPPPRLANSVLAFMFCAPPILAKGSAEADAAATGAVGLGYGFFVGALKGSAIPLLNAGPAGAGVGAAIAD